MNALTKTLVALTLAFGASVALAADPITPIGDLKRGTTATIQGTVERITDEDEFRLSDASGSITVYIGPDIVDVNVGEQVTVRGFIDNDLIKEVYARSMVRADGSTHTFSHRYE